MEGILKRNCSHSSNNYNHSHLESIPVMRSYSSSDNHYTTDTNIGSSRFQFSNSRQGHIDDNMYYTNGFPNSNNYHYSPEKSELEKLFSHATEVKGDLESVIHALVGIIGNSSAESRDLSDPGTFDSTAESKTIPLNEFKSEILPSNYIPDFNYKWQNDNTPSVNVENVLKNVRANKLKSEKFLVCNDSSQSSGSSKERIGDKFDFNSALQSNNNPYKESFRSMLSDPGHMDQMKPILSDYDNPRKHKSLYSKLYKDDENWNSGEICVKKIRSTNPSIDFSDDISTIQLENNHPISEPMITETHHTWSNNNQIGNNSLYSENLCKMNRSMKDMSKSCIKSPDCNIYRNISNYNWSPGKDFLNEISANGYIDESSCSPWSKVSPNNSQLNTTNANSITSHEKKFDKQTPSVSVSDSEGSIEPVRDPPVKRIPRLPSLCTQLRNKQGNYELVLVNQPEQQHRARYMTEGSRGAVKDRSGNGYPTVQLLGWKQAATLQIFVGSEDGRLKPHNFYQACKVTGKQVSSCKERIFDNAGLIEVQLDAKENQTIILDCIGILKLRNVDVERRAGIQRVKQKSTMARLVFRVNLPHGDGYFTCLQVTSDPILCTQPVGTPEISKMSLYEGSCKGNMELFIIGKNIVKGTQVIFQDYSEHRSFLWQAEAKIDTEYLQQTHLICIVPPYCNDKLKSPVTVQVVLNCAGRLSEPRHFTYIPAEMHDIIDNSAKSLKFVDWKIDKPHFDESPPFSVGNCSSNMDIPNNLSNSTNEILFGVEYMKSNKNSFNSNDLFTSINDETNYSPIICKTKVPNDTPIHCQMAWMPSSNSKDIPLSDLSSSNERFCNSLDSDIENDCLIKEDNPIQVARIKTMNNLPKSAEILTNL